MKNEVRYMDDGGQPVHCLWTRAVQQPDEQCMELEEGGDVGRMSLLGEFLDYCFADRQPGDWRWAMRRMACVLRISHPASGKEMEAELALKHPMRAEYPLGTLASVRHDPGSLERLVLWLCGGQPEEAARKTRAARDAGARLYLLAQGARPELLRMRQGKAMSFEEMAEAFGEPRDGARQRWSWRAEKLLAGLPKMEWQRSDLAREKSRQNATDSWKRRKESLSEQSLSEHQES